MNKTAQTAQESFENYKAAFDDGNLIQEQCHQEKDGRKLAFALGVSDEKVGGPLDCPAKVMPRWLVQMFFDNQYYDNEKLWGLQFYEALDRINGDVPFSVIHDWHSTTVYDLALEDAILRKRDTEPHEALRSLHIRALAGEKISADIWQTVLRNVYADADEADAYTEAYTYADTTAAAYILATTPDYINNSSNCANAWEKLAQGMVDALNRVKV